METYSIEADGQGGYQVRATDAAEGSYIAGRFSTMEQAQKWANDQTQLAMRSANASDVA